MELHENEKNGISGKERLYSDKLKPLVVIVSIFLLLGFARISLKYGLEFAYAVSIILCAIITFAGPLGEFIREIFRVKK